ncbi:Zn finger domain containing protein [Halapricum desulfuricans]|uniref:Zn finger domain containing protein n=1 Tax=Halapricum desulfuricans TaxID=2841257 RepID=A0A897NKT9_9EURY|nr:hypothetical protein [Halapricum desulfuricans]QSG11563.1 Zn finger domain containing protein [Halapricum desulfuricans]
MSTSERDHRDEAILALAAADYRAAGDAYTHAAYGELAGLENHYREALDRDSQGWAGDALAALFLAGVCYRLAGQDQRAHNRAEQGRAVAVDQREHVLEAAVDRGEATAFVADFHALAGDRSAAASAYDRAGELYDDADVPDPAGTTTRPLLQAGTDLLLQLSRPDDVSWDDVHGTGSGALARRLRFRRNRLPELLDGRLEAGRLHPPRGSTEYDADFQCPDCGASDVNYVADAVLCLRCASVIEKR